MVVYPLIMPYCGLFGRNGIATNEKGAADEGRSHKRMPLMVNPWYSETLDGAIACATGAARPSLPTA